MTRVNMRRVKQMCEELADDICQLETDIEIEETSENQWKRSFPKQTGLIRAKSLILTRALADMRRY